MDLAVLDERDFFTALQENNRQTFLKMIEKYDAVLKTEEKSCIIMCGDKQLCKKGEN